MIPTPRYREYFDEELPDLQTAEIYEGLLISP